MSSKFALLGHIPLSTDDQLIVRGLHIIAPSQLNPNVYLPLGPSAPPNAVYEERSSSLVAGEVFAMVIVLAFTISRLLVRKLYKRSWGIDDWMIIPGALGCLTYLSLDITSETLGCMGKHLWECTYSEIAWYVKLGQIQEPIFYFTVFSVKLSIALANRRIIGISSQRWRYVHWTFIGTFLCLLPITTSLNMFQCLPVPAGYSLLDIGAMADPRQIVCLYRYAISIATRVLHIVTDLALLCVPIIIITRLKMPRPKKCRLSAVFAIGGMPTIASTVRNVLIVRYMDDITWQAYNIYCSDVLDISFAVIVASLPALNAVVDTSIRRMKASLGSRSSARHLFSQLKGRTRQGRSYRNASTIYIGDLTGPYGKQNDETLSRDNHVESNSTGGDCRNGSGLFG